MKGLTAALVSPVPEEAVHVAVGQQGADDPALRRAAGALLAAAHAPSPLRVRFLDRCLEPHLDEAQDMAVDDPCRDRTKQFVVRDRVEILRQVGVHHVGEPLAQQSVHRLDRIDAAAARSIAIGSRFEVRLEDRLQYQLGCGLHHPVPDRGDDDRIKHLVQ